MITLILTAVVLICSGIILFFAYYEGGIMETGTVTAFILMGMGFAIGAGIAVYKSDMQALGAFAFVFALLGAAFVMAIRKPHEQSDTAL
jgi:hypothetical protein